MGVFDRLLNLGKGLVATRGRSAGEEERLRQILEAELAARDAPEPPAEARALSPSDEPDGPDEPDEPDEPRPVRKTL